MIQSLVWLTALWVALWGEPSPGNIAAGLAIAAVLEIAFPTGARTRHRIKPIPAISFGLHMFGSIVSSSVRVIVAVLRPTPARVAVSMIDVDLESSSPSVVAVTVNTISLTPGTLTIDHDDDGHVITVHVLGDVDEATFRQQVLDHERRVAAFLVPRVPSAKGDRS